jgi:uncharacterized repeat protein (TIGR03837 family)
MDWDLFCRVIDNHGDIGVCWRLATDLASRGEQVRLWIDDPSALAWMAPVVHPGLSVRRWTAEAAPAELGEVVVEAFGCDPPESFVRRMASAEAPPVWINLEYLSAEAYVERSHGLASPQSVGPGAGLAKWFFYPGFTPSTGGLIREGDLRVRQQRFDAGAWLDRHALRPRPGERVVSLFCYDNPALPALLDALAAQPTLLLAAAGAASAQVERTLGPGLARGALRSLSLPFLAQSDYDHLLWASDLNFVRGEDSFVRAQWAAKPFIWQAYPQADSAHARKVQAFADRFLAGAGSLALAEELRRLFAAWNGLTDAPPALPALAPWGALCAAWRDGLLAQGDLATQLLRFVAERR